jgi:hypothetical protein
LVAAAAASVENLMPDRCINCREGIFRINRDGFPVKVRAKQLPWRSFPLTAPMHKKGLAS